MAWALVFFLAVMLGGSVYANVRFAKRLFQFDELLRLIVDPMYEYRDELARIATAEGLLHDHPEVIAFHRANMIMLERIDAAAKAVRDGRPQEKKPKGLPPKVV